jgi:hypothetical protein
MLIAHMVSYKAFLDDIKSEIAQLSLGSLQFAGAIIAVQPQFESKFVAWVIEEIEKAAKLDVTSPIVVAAIKIYICAKSRTHAEARSLCMPEFALIEATGKLADLEAAASFVNKMAKNYVSLISC